MSVMSRRRYSSSLELHRDRPRPRMADVYRQKVGSLCRALESEKNRTGAGCGGLAAPIADLEEGRSIILRGVERSKQVQIRRELHAAVTTARRDGEIGDPLICRLRRVDGKVHFADDTNVGTRRAKRFPVEHRRLLGDLDSHDVGGRRAGEDEAPQSPSFSSEPS